QTCLSIRSLKWIASTTIVRRAGSSIKSFDIRMTIPCTPRFRAARDRPGLLARARRLATRSGRRIRPQEVNVLERLVDGRTDLVFDYLSQGHAATAVDSDGVALIKWCAYYGDVSAIRYLLIRGESLATLGANLDLSGAAFHGHWQLCQFLIENGADVNDGGDTGETPLHAALCKANRPVYDEVVKVLLAAGANPNAATRASMETDCFMRD